MKKYIIVLYLLHAHKFIRNIKNWWKLWSVRVYALIYISPDVYNAVSAMGWLEEAPTPFKWTIRVLACVGIVSRLIKQQKLEEQNHDKTIP